MANRECYPSSLFPLRGDLSAEAGATSVNVVGIQTIPVSSLVGTAPVDGLVLGYAAVNGDIEQMGTAGIAVNGVMVSMDYDIFVNRTLVQVNGASIQ